MAIVDAFQDLGDEGWTKQARPHAMFEVIYEQFEGWNADPVKSRESKCFHLPTLQRRERQIYQLQ